MIAALRVKEDYKSLAEGFKETFSAINKYIHKPSIQIKDMEFTLKFFLCADYKVCTVYSTLKVT